MEMLQYQNANIIFFFWDKNLYYFQRDARRGLMEAKLFAKEKMINQRTPKILNDNLLSLVGLKVSFNMFFRLIFGLANLINTYSWVKISFAWGWGFNYSEFCHTKFNSYLFCSE